MSLSWSCHLGHVASRLLKFLKHRNELIAGQWLGNVCWHTICSEFDQITMAFEWWKRTGQMRGRLRQRRPLRGRFGVLETWTIWKWPHPGMHWRSVGDRWYSWWSRYWLLLRADCCSDCGANYGAHYDCAHDRRANQRRSVYILILPRDVWICVDRILSLPPRDIWVSWCFSMNFENLRSSSSDRISP